MTTIKLVKLCIFCAFLFFVSCDRSKVFDFDDWNSYAVAHFTPYKLEASFDASMSSSVEREKLIDFDNLGGRLTQSMSLNNRGRHISSNQI